MKTFPQFSEAGLRVAFEVENAYIGVGKVVSLLKQVAGVSEVQRRRPFSSSSDVHAKFYYLGQPFIVWELFGDNSRYWVGPEDVKGSSADVSPIEDAFDSYKLPWPRKVVGDLVSLNFKSLLGMDNTA